MSSAFVTFSLRENKKYIYFSAFSSWQDVIHIRPGGEKEKDRERTKDWAVKTSRRENKQQTTGVIKGRMNSSVLSPIQTSSSFGTEPSAVHRALLFLLLHVSITKQHHYTWTTLNNSIQYNQLLDCKQTASFFTLKINKKNPDMQMNVHIMIINNKRLLKTVNQTEVHQL